MKARILNVWALQQLMTSDAYKSADYVSTVKGNSHFAEALKFLKARATMDSSLTSYVEFWKQ